MSDSPQQVSLSIFPPKIKHYEVRQCLGEGGFGRVFEAWDKQLCRSVAVKQLKNNDSGDLLKEAQLAAALHHPAFVKIFTIEQEPDGQSVIMELIQGKNLYELQKQQQVDQTLALDILQQAAKAMAEAHEAGLIHGDLKPSNLMLDDKGRVRILDFGLAKISDPDLTRATTHIDPQGTVRYMAPELLNGKTTSTQTDIYALGVILYELLTGSTIFPQLHGIALATTILQSSSISWEFPQEMSPDLCRLVIAMTERDPAKRIASMQELTLILSKLQQGQTYTTTTVKISPKRLKWFGDVLLRSKKLWTGLLVGSLDLAEEEFNNILEHYPKNAAAVAGLSRSASFHWRKLMQYLSRRLGTFSLFSSANLPWRC